MEENGARMLYYKKSLKNRTAHLHGLYNLNHCWPAVPLCLEFLFVVLEFSNMANKIYLPKQ